MIEAFGRLGSPKFAIYCDHVGKSLCLGVVASPVNAGRQTDRLSDARRVASSNRECTKLELGHNHERDHELRVAGGVPVIERDDARPADEASGIL